MSHDSLMVLLTPMVILGRMFLTTFALIFPWVVALIVMVVSRVATAIMVTSSMASIVSPTAVLG